MWRTILLSLLTGTVCLAGNSDSPIGVWATQIVGKDHGVCYLTFSNDLSVTGYGISIDALGPFDVAGNWLLDGKGRLVGGFAQFIEGGGAGARFKGKVNNNKMRIHVSSTSGRFNFKGEPANDIPDLTGPWVFEGRVKNQKFFADCTATLSTNVPARFDIAGMGTSGSGNFSVSGGVLVTPDGRLGAFLMSDSGTSFETAAFVGKVISRGRKLVLRGRNDENDPVSIRGRRLP